MSEEIEITVDSLAGRAPERTITTQRRVRLPVDWADYVDTVNSVEALLLVDEDDRLDCIVLRPYDADSGEAESTADENEIQ